MWARKTFQFPGRAVSLQLFTQRCFDLLLKSYTEAEIRNSKSSFVSKNASVSFSKRRCGEGGSEQGKEKGLLLQAGLHTSVSENLILSSLRRNMLYVTLLQWDNLEHVTYVALDGRSASSLHLSLLIGAHLAWFCVLIFWAIVLRGLSFFHKATVKFRIPY